MTLPVESLPRRVRQLYAVGSTAGSAITQTWALWLIYFYAPPSDETSIALRVPEVGGLDARVVLGLVLTLARLIEALDDPLLGYWTDRARTRWGRRIPFVLFGTPFWCLTFVLLFLPPVAGASSVNLAFLFITAVAFFLTSNIAGAPIEALLPHLARTNDDRVAVATLQVIFGVIGAAIGLSLSALLVQLVGFAGMVIAIAAIALATRYVSLGGVWRHALRDNTPSEPGFWKAVTGTFRNAHFIAFLPSFVCFQVGAQLLVAMLPFYVGAILPEVEVLGFKGADDEGIFTFLLTAVIIASMLAAVPFFAAAARRYGKATAYRFAMLGSAAAFPLFAFAGSLPLLPPLGQAIVAVMVAGAPTAGVFLFPGIITADITDDDAGNTGSQRAGMFYGAQNLVEKLASSVTPLLFALLLLAGDSASDPLGVRLVGPAAGLFVLLGYLSFRRYRLEVAGERSRAPTS